MVVSLTQLEAAYPMVVHLQINTNTSIWASQLVTVKRTWSIFDYDYVVLTFAFTQAISVLSVELDLLLCPDWNINAPAIIVYGANATNSLAFRHRFGDFLAIKGLLIHHATVS